MEPDESLSPGGGNPEPAHLAPGQSTGGGRYSLKRPIGRGGFGVVWLAQDLRLSEDAALKFLPREISNDPVALEDMRRETLKSRKLTHPNIIRIYDLFEVEGEPPFIAMEFVEGETLSQLRLRQPQQVFTWEFLAPLASQLCEALDYAHGEKVVHRDLKPSNLMLDGKGRLKLADFGLAAAISDSMSRVSLRHTASGTLLYMSPQQMDGEAPRATDDIYALGATLFELLTGKPPFYSGDVAHQVRNLPAKPMEERLAEYEIANPIPPAVAAVIMACLSKDPAQRPQSARAVAEWIGLSVPQNDTTDGVAASLTSGSEEGSEVPSARRSAAGTLIWLGGTVAVMFVAAVVAWLVHHKHSVETAATPSPVVGAIQPSPPSGVAAAGQAQPWQNSLGQKFVPVGNVLFAIWETRVQDFEVFVKESGYDATVPVTNGLALSRVESQREKHWKNPGINRNAMEPVAMMNFVDAWAFCQWLTRKERAAGVIGSNQTYRLPSVEEWNLALGGMTLPQEWLGQEAAVKPVASFPANSLGIYDLEGNLREWCADGPGTFDAGHGSGHLIRGPSWKYPRSTGLKMATGVRDDDIGFRVVVALGDEWPSLTSAFMATIPSNNKKPPPVEPTAAMPFTFTKLFNGLDLSGFSGNSDYWSVENGIIVGKIGNAPKLGAGFLIMNAPPRDFELKLTYRLQGTGPVTLDYRSAANRESGRAYSYAINLGDYPYGGVKGPGSLFAHVITKINTSTTSGLPIPTRTSRSIGAAYHQPVFYPNTWNELVVTASGSRLIHRLNGSVAVDFTDADQARRVSDGSIHIYLPPLKDLPRNLQIRDLQMRRLPAGPAAKR